MITNHPNVVYIHNATNVQFGCYKVDSFMVIALLSLGNRFFVDSLCSKHLNPPSAL